MNEGDTAQPIGPRQVDASVDIGETGEIGQHPDHAVSLGAIGKRQEVLQSRLAQIEAVPCFHGEELRDPGDILIRGVEPGLEHIQEGTDGLCRGHATGRDIVEEDLVRGRSEEHTSELQSLMRISYAVFCLKKKKNNNEDN